MFQVNQKFTNIIWEYLLLEKDIKTNNILEFFGFKLFIEKYQAKALKNQIKFEILENQEIFKIFVPIEEKMIEFKLQKQQEDLKASLQLIQQNVSTINQQVQELSFDKVKEQVLNISNDLINIDEHFQQKEEEINELQEHQRKQQQINLQQHDLIMELKQELKLVSQRQSQQEQSMSRFENSTVPMIRNSQLSMKNKYKQVLRELKENQDINNQLNQFIEKFDEIKDSDFIKKEDFDISQKVLEEKINLLEQSDFLKNEQLQVKVEIILQNKKYKEQWELFCNQKLQEQSLKNEDKYLQVNQIEEKIFNQLQIKMREQEFKRQKEEEMRRKKEEEIRKKKQQEQIQGKKQEEQLKQKQQEELLNNKDLQIQNMMQQGKDGTDVTRQIDKINKKVIFKRTKGDDIYKNCFSTMGYLNQNYITNIKIKFKEVQYGGFGIGRDELDLTSFSQIRGITDNNNYPFYGIQPEYSYSEHCNIPEFKANFKYKNMKANEQYEISYDPIQNELTIEGQRLKKKIVRKIKSGKYYFVAFCPYTKQEITVEFL